MPRLKGLDEFEPPAFVGRIGRVERRRRLLWQLALAVVVLTGTLVGLLLP